MAESNVQAPIFRSAIWGLSDDIFSWLDQSFFASKNINIRDNSRWISLNNALVKDTDTIITEKINAIFKTTTGKMVAFGDSWGIYWKNTTTWAKIITDSPATKIYSAVEFNWYLYRTTASYLHRLAIWNLSSNITATDVINRQSLWSSTFYPLLVSMWDMYVWHAWAVGKVAIDNVWEALMTIETGWKVEFLTDLGWSIRVQTESTQGNSNLYLWDWISTNPDQTIPLKGYDIRQSVIFNWYNYLVTNRWLGILDWYKIHPVKKITTFTDNFNSCAVHNEKLYVWGTGWVYVYGTKDIKYPEVLNMAFSSSNGQSSDEIYAIYSDWIDLYVAWGNGTTYGIDKLSTTVYYTSWYLDTKAYYGNSLAEVKEVVRALVWYSKLLAWEGISIYYSLDNWAYTKIIDIDSTTVTQDLWTEELLRQADHFQYIQFRIMLSGNGTTTPSFYLLDLIFNIIW